MVEDDNDDNNNDGRLSVIVVHVHLVYMNNL